MLHVTLILTLYQSVHMGLYTSQSLPLLPKRTCLEHQQVPPCEAQQFTSLEHDQAPVGAAVGTGDTVGVKVGRGVGKGVGATVTVVGTGVTVGVEVGIGVGVKVGLGEMVGFDVGTGSRHWHHFE